MEPGSTPGRIVRWARKRAGLTQLELAQACDMSQPAIARIERGKVVPRASTLIQLLEATGHELVVIPRRGRPEDREEPLDGQRARALAALDRLEAFARRMRAEHPADEVPEAATVIRAERSSGHDTEGRG